ncbi:MAG: DUF4430 domain-containing protein [Clostridiales bacterium]|nr:DUF4430 domain-containing protein [Clostridiales bacterium]
MKRLKWIIVALMLLISMTACNGEDNTGKKDVEIIISKDFGNEILSINKHESKGDTVLDVMQANYEVETAYGGSFINGIDGIVSGFTGKKNREKVDWFYYVNGILAQIGSGDFEIRAGDVVIWDYHDWNYGTFFSSIIGAYPINFKSNPQGEELESAILYLPGFKNSGERLQSYLKEIGIQKVNALPMDEDILADEALNSVVIGVWDEIMQFEYIKNVYKNKEKTGLYFEFDDKLKILDHNGNVADTYERGAVMASVLKDYGAMSALWLVTGNNEEDIEKSIDILCEDAEEIKGAFSVIVTGDEIINLPIVRR